MPLSRAWAVSRVLIAPLTMYHRKLSTEQLRSLLGQVNAFFYNLPSHIRNAEPATRTRIVEERARLSAATTTEEARVVAGDVGGWLHEYLS